MSEGRLRLTLALLVGAAALAACSSDQEIGGRSVPGPTPEVEPSVAVGQAQGTYGSLVADVVTAVAAASVPGRPATGDRETVYYDADLESCTFSSLQYEFDTVFGEDASWDDVRAAVAGVLEPEGFEVSDLLDIPGGSNGFDADTADGTRLEVRSQLGDPSTVSLAAPVEGECDTDLTETLPPLRG